MSYESLFNEMTTYTALRFLESNPKKWVSCDDLAQRYFAGYASCVSALDSLYNQGMAERKGKKKWYFRIKKDLLKRAKGEL